MSDSPSTVEAESPSTSAPASGEGPASADVVSTPVESGADVSGDSSPASGAADTRAALLEAVRKAAPRREQPSRDDSAGQPGNGASPAPGAQKGDDVGPLTRDEWDLYPAKTKKRISQLRDEVFGLKREIEPLRAQAATTAQLQQFLKTADIAKEDFGLVLDLAAAIRRGDFRTFLEGVMPYVNLAQESLGITLPSDLATAVRQGHMSPDAAKYVAQERTARQLAEARATRMTQDITSHNASQAQAQFTQSVHQAVLDWENTVRRSDPDYARKEAVVRDLLHAVVQERGPPRSPQDAVEVAKAAYERANTIVSRFNPNPRPTQRIPSSINRNAGAAPVPVTIKDAVHQALARSR